MSIIFGIILAFIYMYFIFQIGSIEKGKTKNGVMLFLMIINSIITAIFSVEYIGAFITAVLILLFDLFYDEKSFAKQWKWILTFVGSVSMALLLNTLLNINNKIVIIIAILLLLHLVLNLYRSLLQIKTLILILIINCIYIYLAYVFSENLYGYLILLVTFSTFVAFEIMLAGYNTTFKRKTTEFQEELLVNQYEEIKAVYLNMRGFRHDYHNHIQVIKAHLYMNKLDLVDKYLLELEGELERIDSRIRSGNLMLDAILNSKIAIAEKYNIEVTCKAEVPEKLPITDIDLCVVLGNLLDNAIESCQKVQEKRFIRIYIAKIKKQIYISIQNAAKEELNFNERNYITTKRGNHGLGMKRVSLLVDKYQGYLNLQNEPGIFAAEVTLSMM